MIKTFYFLISIEWTFLCILPSVGKKILMFESRSERNATNLQDQLVQLFFNSCCKWFAGGDKYNSSYFDFKKNSKR